MAHNTEKLRELLERVEKASGPTWSIDQDLCRYAGMEGLWPTPTSSLDASIALVERMLPGWFWFACGNDKRGRAAAIVTQDDDLPEEIYASTAPLAILSALLRALISQAEGEGA